MIIDHCSLNLFFVENISSDEKKRLLLKFSEAGKPSKKYYTLSFLAIIIATFGLISNSAATVIGAMLVAPLMQPILLAAIALVTARMRLLTQATDAMVKGVILSVIIATFITLFVPIFELPHEVLVRSKPNILDMFIALAAGAAGMYVMIKKDSATLPGVAISVSLMPPLSAIGIGLATRNYAVAYGAGLLFITNLVAIISAGAWILFMFGFRPYAKTKEGILREGAIISFATLTILTILLSSTFIKVSRSEKLKSDIKDELTRQIQALTDDKGKLQAFNVDDQGVQVVVSATILSQENLTPDDMDVLTNALAYRTEESINLQATVVPVLIGGRVLETEEKEKIQKEKQLKPELGNKAPIIASGSAEPYMAPAEPWVEGDSTHSATPTNSPADEQVKADNINLSTQVQGVSTIREVKDEEL